MSENETPAPEATIGLPSGLKSEAVLARKRALIGAGTEPLLAEKLAIDAESAQVARDKAIAAEAKAAAKRAEKEAEKKDADKKGGPKAEDKK